MLNRLKNKKFLLSYICLICSVCSYSQEGIPLYTDYLSDNYHLIYPSMAGLSYSGKFRMSYRKQWIGVKNSPQLFTLSTHMRFYERSGLGIILHNDSNGNHSEIGGTFTYAYHLNLTPRVADLKQLSFGVSFSMVQNSLDQTRFYTRVIDPSISNTLISDYYLKSDIGFSYHHFEWFTHFVIKNFFGSDRSIYSDVEYSVLKKYLLSSGYSFGRRALSFEPSFLIQLEEYTNSKILDLNLKSFQSISYNGRKILWEAISYRREWIGEELLDAPIYTFLLGLNTEKYFFSYSFSNLFDSKSFRGGFHQFTLGFNFLESKKPYICLCPSANY